MLIAVPVVVASRSDLSIGTVRQVAWEGEPVVLAPEAAERMERAHAAFEAFLAARLAADPGALLYGVTTGPGDAGNAVLSDRARDTRPRGLWTAASFGEPLPERVTRAIVLARLANLVDGHAGARPALALAVAAMLDGGPLPAVPARGNGGSGEILALGHLFGELADGLDLEPREKMALINGSPCAAALVADAALGGRARLALAERTFALSVEAIRAPLDGFAPELGELWGDEHEAAALASLGTLLEGGAPERQAHQGPVSHRVLPRVLGRVREAQGHAERTADGSLSAVTDNPVFLPPAAGRPAAADLQRRLPQRPRAPRAGRSCPRLGRPGATRPAPRRQALPAPRQRAAAGRRVDGQAVAHGRPPATPRRRGRSRRPRCSAWGDSARTTFRPRLPRLGQGHRGRHEPRADPRRACRARLAGAARRGPGTASGARAVPRRDPRRLPADRGTTPAGARRRTPGRRLQPPRPPIGPARRRAARSLLILRLRGGRLVELAGRVVRARLSLKLARSPPGLLQLPALAYRVLALELCEGRLLLGFGRHGWPALSVEIPDEPPSRGRRSGATIRSSARSSRWGPWARSRSRS